MRKLIVATALAAPLTAPAIADESIKSIIAAQVRAQGYPCDAPMSATRDRRDSRPDEAAWVLKCENVTYRVRLIPNMAAHIEIESLF